MFEERDDFTELAIDSDTGVCARLHHPARTGTSQAYEPFRQVLAGSGAFVPELFIG